MFSKPGSNFPNFAMFSYLILVFVLPFVVRVGSAAEEVDGDEDQAPFDLSAIMEAYPFLKNETEDEVRVCCFETHPSYIKYHLHTDPE